MGAQQVRVIWWEKVPPLHGMEMALSVVVNAQADATMDAGKDAMKAGKYSTGHRNA